MCTSEEIITQPPFRRPLPDSGAWVHPVRATAIASQGGGFATIDFSGAFSPNETNIACRIWTDPNVSGLIVKGLKVFEIASCAEFRSVACCR
jgi:hypothetical protein